MVKGRKITSIHPQCGWLSAELPSNYSTNGNMVEHIILIIYLKTKHTSSPGGNILLQQVHGWQLYLGDIKWWTGHIKDAATCSMYFLFCPSGEGGAQYELQTLWKEFSAEEGLLWAAPSDSRQDLYTLDQFRPAFPLPTPLTAMPDLVCPVPQLFRVLVCMPRCNCP